MNITRRDLLRLAGGSALGVLFSPLPWKLMDDSAIWSQNWSKIPKLAHGPLTTRYTSCTLCPTGCAVRARCTAGVPNMLAGASADPISHGALCAAGLVAHHLAYHPYRITTPSAFRDRGADAQLMPVTLDEAIARIAARLRGRGAHESFAILDHQPGRAVSLAYQELCASIPQGIFLSPASREDETQALLRTMTGTNQGSFGIDLDHTRMLLSFGAPLFDEWGAPGLLARVRAAKTTDGLRIVHVEHTRSRTAQNADQWIHARPGTEIVLALAIGNILVAEGRAPASTLRGASDLTEYRSLVSGYTPDEASRITGVSPEVIRDLARSLVSSQPAVVIAGCDPAAGSMGRAANTAIAGLNLLLGSVGREGGFVARTTPWSHAQPHTLDQVPDHSIAVLFIDPSRSGYATSPELIKRKLVEHDSLVVSFTSLPSRFESLADLILPAPAPFESLEEAGADREGPATTFSISPSLYPSRQDIPVPLDVMGRAVAQAGGLTKTPASAEELLKSRSQAIYASHRGSVTAWHNGSTTRVSAMSGADELWTLLAAGGMWSDDPERQSAPGHYSLLGGIAQRDMHIAATRAAQVTTSPVMIPDGTRHAVTGSFVSPLMTKLYQESDLRSRARHLRVNPLTGTQNNLEHGAKAVLETQHGTVEVTVRFDATVMPGVLLVACGPSEAGERSEAASGEVLSLCTINEDGTWRLTPASIRRA